jgi:hypothetical protein
MHVGENINVHRVLVGKTEKRKHLENPGVDERKILKWVFQVID